MHVSTNEELFALHEQDTKTHCKQHHCEDHHFFISYRVKTELNEVELIYNALGSKKINQQDLFVFWVSINYSFSWATRTEYKQRLPINNKGSGTLYSVTIVSEAGTNFGFFDKILQ